jgi:hypothetical protein
VAAIVSVLLHDLVVRDRPATICGRERNPTRIESAIRARFVRDSFHSLSTGLPTGLPPPSWMESRASATGNPRHCLENARSEGTGRAPASAPRRGRKIDGANPWTAQFLPRHNGRAGGSPAGLPGLWAHRRLARRIFGARPGCNGSRGRATSGSQWACAAAFAGPPGSMYLPRCEMHARLRARLEPIGRSPTTPRDPSSVIPVSFTAPAAA